MISSFGHLTIQLALLVALGGALLCLGASRVPEAARWGRRAAYGVAVLVALAVGLMEFALISHDFSVAYVAEHGSRETPLYYTVITLWGALEGSILFWTFLLSLFTVAFLLTSGRRLADIRETVVGVLLAVSSFFLFVIAWPGDPFAAISPVPKDGPGPNVLLQNNWMMGVHPVLVYLGYVGLSVPFALVVASLARGVPGPDIMRAVRRWALVPWTFLSLGIVGGMWWAYAVLGWGGYWSWDPVENASVMPWLVTTAFLHSAQVQERRRMLKTWTLSLIVAAFLLSILGTFLTRSGVVVSVHTFTQSSIGPLFLGFFALVLVVALGLLLARSSELAAPRALESGICRETAFLFNNLLLVAITFTILLGTLFPLVAEALQGTQLSVGAPYFDRVAVPIGVALLFLMGVGPALPWGASRMDELQYRLLGPVATGVIVILVLLAAGVRGVGALVTFGLAGFVFAVTIGRAAGDVRSRQRGTGEEAGRAALRLFAANPRRYGGYLAHVGVLLAIVGIAASQTYGLRTIATVRPGERASLDGYQLIYEGWTPRPGSDKMAAVGTVALYRAGESLGTLSPAVNIYSSQAVPAPAIRSEPEGMIAGLLRGSNPWPELSGLAQGRNPFEDVYVVLGGLSSNPRGPVTLLIIVNPMVGFIWLGGLVLGVGGVISLVPGRRRRHAVRVEAPAVAARVEEAAV